MPTKGICSNCLKETSRNDAELCRDCYSIKRFGKIRVPLEEQHEKRRKYKAEYFQKNKDAILERRKHKPKIDKRTQRGYFFKYKYGISLEDFDLMLQKQNYKCKICGKPHVEDDKENRLYVDHCHKTGEIRHLLCRRCNTGLGLFEDNIQLFKNCINYLHNE
jgi:ribosomal protein L36